MTPKDLPPIIFWGTPPFAVPLLAALHARRAVRAVVTQPDRKQGRGRRTEARSAVKEFAIANHLPTVQPERQDAKFISELTPHLPALFCVVAYGALIPKNVLTLSTPEAVNVHPSLLPALRGPSPIQAAVRMGLRETGITVMQLDAELDHGPILAQEKILLVERETAETLSERCAQLAAQFVPDVITGYLAGAIKPQPQDHAKATFSKLLTADYAALDFTRPAEELDRLIRSAYPWPGAYFVLNVRRIKVIDARPVAESPDRRFALTPDGTLRIACGRGSLDVATLQPENSRIMSARDFVNGYPRLLEI